MKKVKETLSRLDGVDKVDVNFDKKVASVSMKPGKELGKDTVEKAIADAGFTVTAFGKKG